MKMLEDYMFWLGDEPTDETEIDRLKKKCDKQAMMLRRLFPDRYPDTYFICGEGGKKDSNGMPKYIHVCPAYGCDFSYVYELREAQGMEW